MNIKRPYIIAVILLVLTLLTACRTELCYNHFPTLTISLSWEREWERNYGEDLSSHWDAHAYGLSYDEIRPDIPEWVHLIKYHSDGSQSESFLDIDGGNPMVDYKTDYEFLLYNGDTEYIILSDVASLSEARASATTRTRSSSSSYITERHPDTRSTNPPDILYSAYVKQVPHVNMHESKDLPIRMQPLVYTYVIRYEFEYGQEYIALARGALGGMAESVYLRDGRTSDESTIILYDCDVKDYGCEAHVRSFGVPGFPDEYYGRSAEDSQDRPYTLNLEVMLQNGKTLEYNIDITDQMKNQPRGGVIRVSGLKIEKEQAGEWVDSGFDPEIIDWEDHDVVEINIEVSVSPNQE